MLGDIYCTMYKRQHFIVATAFHKHGNINGTVKSNKLPDNYYPVLKQNAVYLICFLQKLRDQLLMLIKNLKIT